MFVVHLKWLHRTHNYVLFFFMLNSFLSNEVNTSSVAAFCAQFTVRVTSPERHHLSRFLYIKALISLPTSLCISLLMRADELRAELNLLTLLITM